MRVTVVGSILVLLVLALFLVSPVPIADLNSKVCDLLCRWAGPGHASGQVAIVEIDEKSLDRLGRWPWPRALTGQLSRAILNAGAASVALDMVFAQEDKVDDRTLAAAIAGQPVAAGYVLKFGGPGEKLTDCSIPPLPLSVIVPPNPPDPLFFRATGAVCSVPTIATAAAGSGFLNAAPDHDGILRHIPVLAAYGDRQYPSLALAAVDSYERVHTMKLIVGRGGAWKLQLDSQTVSLEPQAVLRLRFRGPRHFPSISAADVLAGQVPPGLLRGKIAIVGGAAPGMEGSVLTPSDPLFPSVEVQATAIDNLLVGDTFYRPEAAHFWELAITLLAGSIATLLLGRYRFRWAALGTIGLAGCVWAACAWEASATGMLCSPLPASAALGSALPVLALLQYLQEKTRADRAQERLLETLHHSRQVMQENQERFRRLVENVNDAIIVDDVSGRLVFANRRFREWFGLREGEDENLVLENYVAPEWRAEMRERHDRRMRGEKMADHFEFEGIRSNGTRIWIEALVTPVEENGKIVGSQAALRDTTERKRMEAQYLQAQKMESIGRLAGGVAHDFNNLLTVINGYSEMLVRQMDPGNPFRHYAEEINSAGARAADLTQNLLTFSRKQKVNLRPVNLNVLVADAKKMLERVIGEDIHLITRLSPALGQVVADPGQIHQVLMNLVVNARDAMPGGGDVTIETRNVAGDAGASYAYLSVADTGTGLQEEVKQHLFEPFFTTKDQGKGTGLGLATVYGIMKQSRGRIEVASTLGQGTAFRIYLPIVKMAELEGPRTAAPAPSPRGYETVLLVEDQDSVREFTFTLLEGFGYRVLQASNGPDAIALAEQHPGAIHLLITDIVLPVMDGRVLAEKLKSVHPETKILYISGYSHERLGHDKAADDLTLLQKPFTAEALATRVRRILSGDDRQHRAAPEK